MVPGFELEHVGRPPAAVAMDRVCSTAACRVSSRSPVACTPPTEVVKAIAAGADVAMSTSALLRHGPTTPPPARRAGARGRPTTTTSRSSELRGSMSQRAAPNPDELRAGPVRPRGTADDGALRLTGDSPDRHDRGRRGPTRAFHADRVAPPSATESGRELGLADDLRRGQLEAAGRPASTQGRQVVVTGLDTHGLTRRASPPRARHGSAALLNLYSLARGPLPARRPAGRRCPRTCAGCAPCRAADVEAAMTSLGCSAEVVTLDPHTLDEVLETIARRRRPVGGCRGTVVDVLRRGRRAERLEPGRRRRDRRRRRRHRSGSNGSTRRSSRAMGARRRAHGRGSWHSGPLARPRSSAVPRPRGHDDRSGTRRGSGVAVAVLASASARAGWNRPRRWRSGGDRPGDLGHRRRRRPGAARPPTGRRGRAVGRGPARHRRALTRRSSAGSADPAGRHASGGAATAVRRRRHRRPGCGRR